MDIKNYLLEEKIKIKNVYDLNFLIAKEAIAYNKNIHGIKKYSPKFLFYRNPDKITKRLKINEGFPKFRNIESNLISESAKVLISTRCIHKCYKLNLKFCKTGKRLISRIITGQRPGSTYPVSININYKVLIKIMIYNIYYSWLKEAQMLFIKIL